MESPNPAGDPTYPLEPVLMMLRRMEKLELVVNKLLDAGVISDDMLQWAHLRSTLNHAERLIRLRKRCRKPTGDVEAAANTVRLELQQIEERLKLAV